MKSIIAAILFIVFTVTSGWSQAQGAKQTEDVVYGHKYGMALTMDVFQPTKPNGIGIISIISGGWFSAHEAINPAVYKSLLDRGYTVFAVTHGSQPKYIITEIVQDIHRATRVVRHDAKKYGIDPTHLGVMGGSAGGHLSLMLGTQAASDAMAASKDPIDHESSAVQCIACFFPPTDFLNYGEKGLVADGAKTLEKFKPAFGPLADTEEGRLKLGHEISPIYFLTSNLPPTLIIHGDADTLVPIQQSQIFAERAKEVGATVKIITKPGLKHGWPDWINNDMPTIADWFDQNLRGLKPVGEK